MMEYWNDAKDKKTRILLNPLFHHSTIPPFHYSIIPIAERSGASFSYTRNLKQFLLFFEAIGVIIPLKLKVPCGNF